MCILNMSTEDRISPMVSYPVRKSPRCMPWAQAIRDREFLKHLDEVKPIVVSSRRLSSCGELQCRARLTTPRTPRQTQSHLRTTSQTHRPATGQAPSRVSARAIPACMVSVPPPINSPTSRTNGAVSEASGARHGEAGHLHPCNHGFSPSAESLGV